MRRAGRTDGNHAEIIAALRGMGAQALYIQRPVDLLVGYRGVNVLLEVKDGRLPPSARKLTRMEQAFLDTWPGRVCVVTSPEEAMTAVAEAARPQGNAVLTGEKTA